MEECERWSDSSDSSVFSSFSWWRLKSFAASAADPQLHSDLRVQTGSNYLHDQTQQKVFFKNKKKQLKDKILRENISDAGSQDVRSCGNLKRRRKLWASGVAGGLLPN